MDNSNLWYDCNQKQISLHLWNDFSLYTQWNVVSSCLSLALPHDKKVWWYVSWCYDIY